MFMSMMSMFMSLCLWCLCQSGRSGQSSTTLVYVDDIYDIYVYDVYVYVHDKYVYVFDVYEVYDVIDRIVSGLVMKWVDTCASKYLPELVSIYQS